MKPLNAEIIRLYTEELRSPREIADIVMSGLTPELIRYRLRSYGVKMRTKTEAGALIRAQTPHRPARAYVKNANRPSRAKPPETHAAPLRVLPAIDHRFPPHLQAQFDAHLRQVRMERAWA